MNETHIIVTFKLPEGQQGHCGSGFSIKTLRREARSGERLEAVAERLARRNDALKSLPLEKIERVKRTWE